MTGSEREIMHMSRTGSFLFEICLVLKRTCKHAFLAGMLHVVFEAFGRCLEGRTAAKPKACLQMMADTLLALI